MYDLEIDRVVKEVKRKKAKCVLIQLPDGLKPKANEVAEAIESKTDAKAVIWLSTCFGACDIPLGLEALGIDMIVQFGHNRFHKQGEW